MRTGYENIELCAFGLTKNVISQTTRNQPNKHGSVYWYLTDGKTLDSSLFIRLNKIMLILRIKVIRKGFLGI